MHRIFALIIKEFIAVWQDKRSRFVLIIPPMIQFCVLVFAATLDVQNVDIVVLNRDQRLHSREFLAKLQRSNIFSSIRFVTRPRELQAAIDSGQALLAISIDENFSRNKAAGRPARIQVIMDGRRSNTAQIALSYLQSIAASFGAAPPSLEVLPRYWYNPTLYYPWFTVTGIIGLIATLTSLAVAALSVAREREMGTFDQLLVAPINAWEVLVGKAFPALVVGLGEGTLMLALAALLLGLSVQGSIALLMLSLLAYICSIVGVGLFISSLCRTQQQATLGIFLVMAPASLLSGFATPVENIAPWLQLFNVANPLKYFIAVSRGICLRGMSAADAFPNLIAMLAIAAITLAAATWLYRRKIA